MSHSSFAELPPVDLAALTKPSVVIFGASEASPYESSKPSHSANAPAAIREASLRFSKQLRQFDFDLGRALFGPDGENWRMGDAGDILTDRFDSSGNRQQISQATQQVLSAGGIPLVLGGDDSVPIPWLAGYEGRGPFTVLQVDAHADWGDVIAGNPFGYGSTMRRAAEMPWINAMVQVGTRGLGSGEEWQISDARRWGSNIVTMRDLRRDGLAAAVDAIAPGSQVLVSIDCDGFDPAIVPAVNMPTPGGLTYLDVVELLGATAAKATIAGLALVELVPERDDAQSLSALTAARLAAVALGLMASNIS